MRGDLDGGLAQGRWCGYHVVGAGRGYEVLYENRPDAFGFTLNPDGFGWRDLGIGNFLRSGPGTFPNPNQPDWLSLAPSVDGQMQVMTARDVALTPPQCPTTEAGTGKPYFQKEFFHNGYIKSLKQLVHFYNTRDFQATPAGVSFAFPVTSGHCPPGTVERVTCWPQPEVKNNIDMTTGALGLTDTEENQIVAFLQTLTDGYNPANPSVSTYKNIDTFTGQCSTTLPGQTASTQGNETIIPTFSLTQFPCANGYLRRPAGALAADPVIGAGRVYGGHGRPPYFCLECPREEQ